jgi:hypothetical protein
MEFLDRLFERFAMCDFESGDVPPMCLFELRYSIDWDLSWDCFLAVADAVKAEDK